MKHISVRVPWHDDLWNGNVCQSPKNNPFCLCLKRIQGAKDVAKEEPFAGKHFGSLEEKNCPPCVKENAGFLSAKPYKTLFQHPYQNRDTQHKYLKPTFLEIPPYSCLATPFRYLQQTNQEELDAKYHLSEEEEAPFPSPWVYGRNRQYDILNWFRSEISTDSLVVFYTKSGNPIDENSSRLIIGLGRVKRVDSMREYKSETAESYPFWSTVLEHSVRPDVNKSEGFILPYHEYLALDNDYVKKVAGISKEQAVDEITLSLAKLENSDKIHYELSYVTDFVSNQSMLMILNAARRCLENVVAHRLIKKDWAKQIRWVDEQIAHVKQMAGPFPAFAEALRALGLNYAYMIEHDMREEFGIGIKDNPWGYFDELMTGKRELQTKSYSSELKQMKGTWKYTDAEEREILELLSRFEIHCDNIKHWLDNDDKWEELKLNPYIICEERVPGMAAIPHDVIDLGLIPDQDIQGDWVPKEPFAVDSLIDIRRIRAIVAERLLSRLIEGDTLLSISEIEEFVEADLDKDSVRLPKRYFVANRDFMEEKLVFVEKQAIQLKEYNVMEQFLKTRLIARASSEVDGQTGENWDKVVLTSIDGYDEDNQRSVDAANKQVLAVKMFDKKRLSVLTGSAGTGKTTVVKAFLSSKQIQREGVLLLAPTGKARVRLGMMSGNGSGNALTIAQFLTRMGVYNINYGYCGVGKVKAKYSAAKNIIVDECSMLTTEDFYYLLSSLDLTKINRVILIGDPYQLPPIGAGRPFSDLCSYLQTNEDAPKDAIVELSAVVRTITKGESDILSIASLFRDGYREKNADMILDRIERENLSGDLKVYLWENENDLYEKIESAIVKELDCPGATIGEKIINSIGLNNLEIAKNNPDVVEGFQLLSPVRECMWGVYPINAQFQNWTGASRVPYACDMFPQKIHPCEKVMQLRNEKKKSIGKIDIQLSNGQIGFTTFANDKYLSATFAGVPNEAFRYDPNKSDEVANNLELAYAITIHKSQGSDFDTVIVVIPKYGRVLSRELIYTALTRAKKKLVLMLQGSVQDVMKYTMPVCSELLRRNTNLFQLSVRESKNEIPYLEGLIHRTKDPKLIVRSKSEVIIANELISDEVPFEYEKLLEKNGRRCIPDFSFETASGDVIIWEHLGMLELPSYKASWEKKLKFYHEIGFKEGENLFTTEDHENGRFDTSEVIDVIDKIKELIA